MGIEKHILAPKEITEQKKTHQKQQQHTTGFLCHMKSLFPSKWQLLRCIYLYIKVTNISSCETWNSKKTIIHSPFKDINIKRRWGREMESPQRVRTAPFISCFHLDDQTSVGIQFSKTALRRFHYPLDQNSLLPTLLKSQAMKQQQKQHQ